MERRENLSGPISGPINGVVLEVLRLIQSNPGIKKIAIAQQIRRSETTVKRYVKILIDANLIEYKDSNKTGGFFAKKSSNSHLTVLNTNMSKKFTFALFLFLDK